MHKKYLTDKLSISELGNLTKEQRMERYDHIMLPFDHRSILSKSAPPRSPILDELVAKGIPIVSDYAVHFPKP